MIASIPQKHRKSANVLTVFHTCAMLNKELNMPYQEWLRDGPCETRQPARAQGANSRGNSRKMSEAIQSSRFSRGVFVCPKE